MKSKVLAQSAAETSWVLVFETGEEAMAGLASFAEANSIAAAHFTAIGAFSHAILGYFDWEVRDYSRIPVNEQVEVVTLTGDIALAEDRPKVHAHAVLGRRGGVTTGGHLFEGYVRPTLEVVLTRSPKHLERRYDAASGIALLRM